jgi:hypothetical protein
MKLVIFAAALLVMMHGCTSSAPGENQTANQTVHDMTQQLCSDAGGSWNPQGTCCRDLPEGTPCTKLCVAVCQCGGIAGFRCPAGYECGDYYPGNNTPDALGVCKKVI